MSQQSHDICQLNMPLLCAILSPEVDCLIGKNFSEMLLSFDFAKAKLIVQRKSQGGLKMFKKILIPLDGSELAESVLPHVRALAECTGAEIVLLRVAIVPAEAYLFADPTVTFNIRDNTEAEAQSYLLGKAAELKGAGLKVTAEVGVGPVGQTILDFAKNIHADLIAMSTHGRSGLPRLVIGSVADDVMRNSHIPVLLVRAPLNKN